MTSHNPQRLVRKNIQALHPYVPGEQPKIPGLVKLNTNENPYPPSPWVLRAIKAAVDGRLRLYPNPTAQGLRRKLATLHRCRPENIIVGNGSDELLALAVRVFVKPRTGRRAAANTVQFFTPSYSLYPVLAEIHSAADNPVPLNPDFSIPEIAELKRGRRWNPDAALTFVTTPNAPGGRGYRTRELDRLCRAHRGAVVLDEAYVDFADENAMSLALKLPHVIVARTFSKAYSLCFQRIGYFVGNAELIGALQKIRDSYNVNGLGQVAAEATLEDLNYYRGRFREIIATREQLSRELMRLGFRVFPSQTNFILVRTPLYPARAWMEKLRSRKILVRWFPQRGVNQYLRITIGTPAQSEALVRAVKGIIR